VPARQPGSAELELQLPSEAGSVAVARKALGDLARDVGASEGDVKLAVSEAVTNAVLHAYRDRDPGTISLHARLGRNRLIVAIADDGSGMRPNLESTGLGLGISLITKLASDVRFDSTDSGTTVSMSFPVAARAQMEPAGERIEAR
jgi:anti-sigma regulatory factor (Ser/Thr protein kinase)